MQQTRNIATTVKTPFACAAPRRPSARTTTMHSMRSTVCFHPELSLHHPRLRRRCKRPSCSETRPRHRDPVSVTSIAGVHVINPPTHSSLRQHHHPSQSSRQPSKTTRRMHPSFLVVVRPVRRRPTCRTGPQCAAHSLSFDAQPVGFKQRVTATPVRRRCPRVASRRVAAGAAAWVPQWAGWLSHRSAGVLCLPAPEMWGEGFTDSRPNAPSQRADCAAAGKPLRPRLPLRAHTPCAKCGREAIHDRPLLDMTMTTAPGRISLTH
jgi:hypothetical protein